ncbi:phosphoenolpyruvate carboxykinase (ATP) [Paenibacillus durus]|uniref:HPr kinase/phosphorylase C-terminal domain-containing protein n=1 Tax=Paenibacillus durus ATCC 35681 TaxID=1333534 RepID=A0A0F7F6H8_PAEDU|nr:hypothetical protein [Paenibacillus durus]AKG33378.1 hypothetical protein VK70_01095 [Paenibacillus durus ATCC 35681]
MSDHDFEFRYKAFGFNIASNFLLEGLLPAEGPPEVYIREGKVPVEVPGPQDSHAYTVVENDGFAFRVKDIGTFLVLDGKQIIAEKSEDCEPEAHVLFILGTCMGVLLMQRGLLPVHGSALALAGKHIIITGQSGAGKSTLAAALNRRGCSFLADDIAALQEDERGESWIVPSFPRQKLWRDTAEKIFGSVDSLNRIPGVRDKYHVQMDGEFIKAPKRLDALFELTTHPGSEVAVSEIKGPEKLMVILRNIYRPEIIEFMGKQSEHFIRCSRLASSLPVFHIERPEAGFTVDEQIKGIIHRLKQLSSP